MANKMSFWGVEVKSGESIVVEPGRTFVHLSQACLDEVKKGKGNDHISLFVKIGEKKLVIGHLYTEKIPQLYMDIVFDKKFVLSHTAKSGSVHFQGYIANKGAFGTAEPKVTVEEAQKDIKSEQKVSSSDDDDDEESEDEEFDQVKSVKDGSKDGDGSSDDDDSEDDDDDSVEEHEETPDKVGSKKRAAESSKTPVQKKAKFVTPEKTGGKQGAVHTATPYPSKQAVKKTANSDQAKQQTSNSSGSGAFRCNPCNRSFNSDGALQSHTKAKHGAAK